MPSVQYCSHLVFCLILLQQMFGTRPAYALDDLVKDKVPFIMNSTSGELIVSEALVDEHYDLLILARGGEYTTRIHIEVLVNFQPMFEHRIMVTLDAGSAGTVLTFCCVQIEILKALQMVISHYIWRAIYQHTLASLRRDHSRWLDCCGT